MPVVNLTNLASCKAYFTVIATLHKEIDEFKWGDKDLLKKNNRSNMAPRVLWGKPYDGGDYQGDGTDNIIKNKVLELRYMKVAASQAQDDLETAASECEAVIEQIVAKMFLDKRGRSTESGGWEMVVFKFNGMKTENFEITIGSTRYVGCELRITFQDNTGLQYDASKWNEE
jgi:hypothetical protein